MKKLDRIRDFLIEQSFRLSRLEELGFVRKYTFSASEKIWIHYRMGIVVKTPCIVRKAKSLPKFAIPTLVLPLPKPLVQSRTMKNIFIQPKASLRNRDLAHVRLVDMGYGGSDFKRTNLGWYRGQPVLIDW